MAFADFHLPLFEWVFVGVRAGGGGGAAGTVIGWVSGAGVGTVSVDGGDGV